MDARSYCPCLGIFWYDSERRELFGVYKCQELDIVPGYLGRRVFPMLHQNVWGDLRNAYYNAYGEYVPDEKYPEEHLNPMRELDYTLIPRGRVFSDDRGYQVYLGDWFFSDNEDEQAQIGQMILDEFGLDADETDFIDDVHWHIGHGWGE